MDQQSNRLLTKAFPADLKRVLLVRSGGMDSTLLCALLMVMDIKFDWFRANGVTNNPKKDALEKKAIDMQNEFFSTDPRFKDRWVDVNCIEGIDIEAPIRGYGSALNNTRSDQMITWLLNAMTRASGRDYSHVFMGILSGDQSIQYSEAIKRSWKDIWTYTYLDEAPGLHFPFHLVSKETVLKWYKDLRLADLYQMTWFCELPTTDDAGELRTCCNCGPCTTLHGNEVIRTIYDGDSALKWEDTLFINKEVPVEEDKQSLTISPEIIRTLSDSEG